MPGKGRAIGDDEVPHRENNAKQLVDNMNKIKVLKQILIQGKNWEQSQKKRTLLEKKFDPHGSETTSLHQLDELNDVSLENLVEEEKDDIIELDETSLHFNVKDSYVRTDEKRIDLESYIFNVKECNAMIIEINDEKFYIIFAQFKQQQKEKDWNTVETIIMRTDQSNPAQWGHCFDVACENKTRWRRWLTPLVCSLRVCICNSRPRNSCGSLKSREVEGLLEVSLDT